ncbi:MAG: hypothetical protein ACRDN0_37340 [Trebonia sp.]
MIASGSPWHSSTGPFPGTVRKLDFGLCADAGLIHVTAKLNKPASLIGSTYQSGVTTGKLGGGISVTLTGVSGTTCSATITGTSMTADYNNATHALTLNPNNVSTLEVTHVSAGRCDGLLTNGEKAAFTADLHPSPH